jgi:hypothetical protein
MVTAVAVAVLLVSAPGRASSQLVGANLGGVVTD